MKIHTSIRRGWLAALLTATALAAAASTHASLITWGAATDITGVSDVSTNGTFVDAANLGSAISSPTTIVNGVTFTGWSVSASASSGIFSFSGTVRCAGGAAESLSFIP